MLDPARPIVTRLAYGYFTVHSRRQTMRRANYRLTLFASLFPCDHETVPFEAEGDREAVRDAIAHVQGLTASFVEPIERFTVDTLEIGRLSPDGTHGTRVDRMLYDSSDLDISIAPAPPVEPEPIAAHAACDYQSERDSLTLPRPNHRTAAGDWAWSRRPDERIGRANCPGVVP